jgi:hypothetical protein
MAHWDDTTTWEVALEGWKRLREDTINRFVNSMPDRLRAVIESKGQMTAF